MILYYRIRGIIKVKKEVHKGISILNTYIIAGVLLIATCSTMTLATLPKGNSEEIAHFILTNSPTVIM